MNEFLNLSKIISHALRHSPEEYNLELDEDGWAELDMLVLSIRIKHQEYSLINRDLILAMIASNDKKRHEINGEKIRALYGHSTKTKVKKRKEDPPTFLYHGTSTQNIQSIRKEGLKKMNRQYVHLSSDASQSIRVASRKCEKPILLKIRAFDAALAGIEFYKEGDDIWLCDFVPVMFIEVEI